MTRARSCIDLASDDGLRAAQRGEPLSSNPWRPETLGGKAWALGWNYHALPWPLRALARFCSGWCPQ